jgi:hypothetical protein
VGQHAEDALGDIGRTGAHRKYALEKNSIRDLTATLDTGRKLLAGRHDILRKEVLEARTKEEGASVKGLCRTALVGTVNPDREGRTAIILIGKNTRCSHACAQLGASITRCTLH